MKKTKHVVMSSLFMATLMTGCNEKSSKSSTVSTNFSLTGSGQDAVAQNHLQRAFSFIIPSAIALTPPLLVDSTNLNVSLDNAWIVIKKIQFKSSELTESGESNETNSHYRGPFVIDLLSNSPAPFGDIEVSRDGLRRVKMLLHKATDLPASAPAALTNKSIYLSGLVNGHAFSYAADDTTDFEISGPNAIIPEDSKDLLAVIRLADMIKKINLSGIVSATDIHAGARFPAANPCPLIHQNAPDLYTCFVKGVASEAKFGKDNGDSDLDESDETVE